MSNLYSLETEKSFGNKITSISDLAAAAGKLLICIAQNSRLFCHKRVVEV
jgi:hypothetical protein